MNILSKTLAGAAFAAIAIASHASGVRAVDVPRISNGGTGFIGVTQSAMAPDIRTSADMNVQRVPRSAGEASTVVRGRPNANPDAPMAGAAMPAEMATMGGSSMGTGNPASTRGMLWGTPD